MLFSHPRELSPAAASAMEASAPVETTASETASSMEAAKTGLPSERISSRRSAMIKPAKGAGMHSPGRVAARCVMR